MAKVAARLGEEGLTAVLLEDAEGRRDPTIRYLTGQPGDSLLVISADGRSILIAWDVNLARAMGEADEILAYTDFARLPQRALAGVLERIGAPQGAKVALPSTFAYPRYVTFVEELPDYDLVCCEGGVGDFAASLRAVKDEGEIAIYRRAAAITDELMDSIEAAVRSGAIATELDAALLIERECRVAGCEGPGFETLAAGPTRSFGIHAFPPFGAGAFGAEGMSILDFGVRLEGYTTDVTMSFIRGNPGPERERMIALVERAHRECVAMCAPGIATRSIAARADELFAEAGLAMPHGLGHGIGLEEHEAPAVRNREDNQDVLEAGHILTIEPGLYDPLLGGVRLEDDVLVTAAGSEKLTHSRIVRL
ncbi:MAG: Xaa-Pro peptidase family protein [Spirochaetaceae bacterium]|nr:Xaa-Pro peptidase family protein [Spirochaetaceae bacterium]